ncbi:YitT family protein [Atopobacter phocae]|uniref:YitT family protein n=1 Tax=Atopobacter phocae TaxID=136492 RepID=UPI00046FE913|nr:YitT family protein [Atopobacter phocae]
MLKKLKNISIMSLFFIVIGSVLLAISTQIFMIPFNLGGGGATGLTLILYYLADIPIYLSNFVINGILLVVGVRYLDKRTMFYTVIFVGMYSLALKVMPTIPVTLSQPVLLPLIVGVITGTAVGIVILGGGTTAGSDIVARLLNKYLGWNTGTALLVVDTIIVIPFFFIHGFETGIITVITVYLVGRVVDFIMYGLNPKKQVVIISDKHHQIATELQQTLDRGITVLHGHGFYTNRQKQVLYMIISRQQLILVNKIVNYVDPNAFFIVSDVQSVNGEGFTFFINEELKKESHMTLEETKNETHSIL